MGAGEFQHSSYRNALPRRAFTTQTSDYPTCFQEFLAWISPRFSSSSSSCSFWAADFMAEVAGTKPPSRSKDPGERADR
jgi:hypothetical protein